MNRLLKAEIVIDICIVVFIAIGILLRAIYRTGLLATAASPAIVIAGGIVFTISNIVFMTLMHCEEVRERSRGK